MYAATKDISIVAAHQPKRVLRPFSNCLESIILQWESAIKEVLKWVGSDGCSQKPNNKLCDKFQTWVKLSWRSSVLRRDLKVARNLVSMARVAYGGGLIDGGLLAGHHLWISVVRGHVAGQYVPDRIGTRLFKALQSSRKNMKCIRKLMQGKHSGDVVKPFCPSMASSCSLVDQLELAEGARTWVQSVTVVKVRVDQSVHEVLQTAV